MRFSKGTHLGTGWTYPPSAVAVLETEHSIHRRVSKNKPLLWTSERPPPQRGPDTSYTLTEHLSNKDPWAGDRLEDGGKRAIELPGPLFSGCSLGQLIDLSVCLFGGITPQMLLRIPP